jgi:thymidylate synthase (FAD)
MPTTSLVHCTPDAEKLVVRMARVSNPANQDNWDTGPKLLGYLIKHKHWSPFELVSMCVQIETERDIAAQILRHRSFSFQELSTRYTQTGQAAPIALRRQDTKNRQNSFDDLPEDVVKRFTGQIHVLTRNLYLTYEEMLQAGVAKECARRILPLCTPTTLYMAGTARSWIHYIELRTSPDTQKEHRDVAEGCKQIFTAQFPNTAEALGWSVTP